MALKKTSFSDEEIAIFDHAIIYKRGEYWQFRMWLAGEGKYARKSLNTRSRSTAIDKGKEFYLELFANQKVGKKYFSLTAKEGVAKYVAQREKDVEAGALKTGRVGTIKTHLKHWLDFIGRDTKLKELERTDCENYFYERTKTKKNLSISQTTVQNEQSTINAMMAWLFKHNETRIDHFEFKKLPRIDRGDEKLRRSMFTQEEIKDIGIKLRQDIHEAEKDLSDDKNLNKLIACYYMRIAIVSGLRTGEQRQLRWQDISWETHPENGKQYRFVKIHVRFHTSKVQKTRYLLIRDANYFEQLRKIMKDVYEDDGIKMGSKLIFSVDGKVPISERAILYHFKRVIDSIEIKNRHLRDLVPYSFRHYYITQKVNSGLTSTAVAEMCGTSELQISRTYYHTTNEKMVKNALSGSLIDDEELFFAELEDEDEEEYED